MKSKAVAWLVLSLSAATSAVPLQGPRQIEITAMQFSFMPNEITLKKGEPVTLVLRSIDVTHGLKIEVLHVTVDEIKKGHERKVEVTPTETGQFEGMCAHYCGKGHGSMTLTVNVVD
jgi:cytochrome c oxidase subunit II